VCLLVRCRGSVGAAAGLLGRLLYCAHGGAPHGLEFRREEEREGGILHHGRIFSETSFGFGLKFKL
jgi:hypothetical protein